MKIKTTEIKFPGGSRIVSFRFSVRWDRIEGHKGFLCLQRCKECHSDGVIPFVPVDIEVYHCPTFGCIKWLNLSFVISLTQVAGIAPACCVHVNDKGIKDIIVERVKEYLEKIEQNFFLNSITEFEPDIIAYLLQQDLTAVISLKENTGRSFIGALNQL